MITSVLPPGLAAMLPATLEQRTVAVRGTAHRFVACGSGPTLLLVHGWAGSWENFIRWLPALCPHFRVVVPDLPGCNGAPVLEGPHTTAAYGAFVRDFLDALDASHAYVGGLCFGANVALELAGTDPDRVDGLLLHTPLYHPRVTRSLFKAQIRVLALPVVYPLVRRLRFNERVTSFYKRKLVEGDHVVWEDNAVNQKNMLLADPRAAREFALDVLRADLTPQLASWRKPLFVIVASNDAFIRYPDFEWIRSLVPGSEVSVIEGGGHGWTAEFIHRQERSLRDFVSYALGAERASRSPS